ncbi:MAG TPA: SMI1/KNR4 family protein [Flavisolibacter sp.]|nr:SMI1/KNR4 family protein [Flavisolibacter sp.]
MHEQLETIKSKLKELKRLDSSFVLFGSSTHRYKLNPTLPLQKIKQFEEDHQIKLPDGYVQFITKIGNGGAGPFYGLERFEDVLFNDLDYKRPDSLRNPSKPFLHTTPWKLEFLSTVTEQENEEEYEMQLQAFEEVYYNEEQMNGVIAICNYGCAVSLNLVVNGEEYGNIWTDGRGGNTGIHPSHELGNTEKITFLNWYERWLDNSLKEIKAKISLSITETVNPQNSQSKPWWKFW